MNDWHGWTPVADLRWIVELAIEGAVRDGLVLDDDWAIFSQGGEDEEDPYFVTGKFVIERDKRGIATRSGYIEVQSPSNEYLRDISVNYEEDNTVPTPPGMHAIDWLESVPLPEKCTAMLQTGGLIHRSPRGYSRRCRICTCR